MSLRDRAIFWLGRLASQDPETTEGAQKVSDLLDDWLAELSQLAPAGKENRVLSSEIWAVAQELLSKGWLQNRARMKPRGYAGDYELFARICDLTLGSDPWGKAFDSYFQNQAAPRAVRFRTQYIATAIVEQARNGAQSVKIVNIGCGPSRDVRSACESLSAEERLRLNVVLVDIDPDALSYSADSLSPYLAPDQIQLERCNLFRLPESTGIGKRISQADLVSCAGLFDYLDSDQAIRMLTFFDSLLKPGGRGIVFHFSPANPTRAYMEWIANWYLNYRTAAELLDLAVAAKINVDQGIHSFVEGLALCLDWEKPCVFSGGNLVLGGEL